MRLAWFSPLPPVRSGIAAYTEEVLPLLRRRQFEIDVYDEARAHDFIWKHHQRPYDLIIYQMGNSLCHAYQWAYLTRYPGLTVLHDGQLHQSRALHLLQHDRAADYRAELGFSHPQAPPGLFDLIVSGLGGSLYYLWPMLRPVVASSRAIAVHHEHLAAGLRERFPDAAVDVVRMGVRPASPASDARRTIRRHHGIPEDALLFACYGRVTAEKRIGAVLRALEHLSHSRPDVHLLMVGETSSDYDVLAAINDVCAAHMEARATLTGFVADSALDDYLEAADVCVCLRWPTAGETSASWLRCLAAGKPTIVSGLVQMAHIPRLDPRGWLPLDDRGPGMPPIDAARRAVSVAIDVLDEDRTLQLAMSRLAADRSLRERLGANARDYWLREHTLERMAGDYSELIERTAERPPPKSRELPAHLAGDGTDLARRLTERVGVSVEFLEGRKSHDHTSPPSAAS